jgi:hypothetical protein
VPAPTSQAPPNPPHGRPERKRPSKKHIYKYEAAGILIVGTLILILTIARYGHHIAWGAR